MTEWRSRYKGYGVLVYWHVETNAACIYSQLPGFSQSEVAAMIEGLIRHDTQMRVEKNLVDSHGQSEVAFVFFQLLGGLRLMPRLKHIKYERPACRTSLTRLSLTDHSFQSTFASGLFPPRQEIFLTSILRIPFFWQKKRINMLCNSLEISLTVKVSTSVRLKRLAKPNI